MVPEERSECGGVVMLVVRVRVRVGVKTTKDGYPENAYGVLQGPV